MAVNEVVFKIGGPAGVPAAGEKAIIFDTDGTAKTLDETGAKAALGGGGGVDAGTRVTNGSLAQDWLMCPTLDLNADGGYDFEGEWILDGAVYTLQPNSLTTNVACIVEDVQGTTVNSRAATLTVLSLGGTNTVVRVRGSVIGKTAETKYFTFACTAEFGGSSTTLYRMYGYWTAAVNMTSINLHSTVANSIKAGSYMISRKRGITA